ALQEPPRSAAAEKQLWQWSEQITPVENVHDYTQAIKDLGAMVCIPRKPLCDNCPISELCQARKLGLEQQLPLKQVAKPIPTRHEVVLLIDHRGRYLVRRRLAEGFLGGMWEFPMLSFQEDEDPESRLRLLFSDFGLRGNAEPIGSSQHVYSHFRLKSAIYYKKIEDLLRVSEGDDDWFSLDKLKKIALHGAHKKVLVELQKSGV
ncbi:MAG: A/G-specific adenine glycosylase, partial [Deltaproteobacteria bacterium]